jgi:glycosyltransferase involved in cell wall biosynthesis
MALGIPAVVSPVGVNSHIVEHGTNGFLASGNNEWKKYLSLLVADAKLRGDMGCEGRQKIFDTYSVSANAANFLSLFE